MIINNAPPWMPTRTTVSRRYYPMGATGEGETAVAQKPSSLFDSPALPKVAMVVAAYHGMRRNRGSIAWGLAWGLAGRLFPLLVPALAFAQGYAKEKGCP
jgi:hypothetical protein